MNKKAQNNFIDMDENNSIGARLVESFSGICLLGSTFILLC